MKQLFEDFLKLGVGAIFIAVVIIGPILIAIMPVVLVLCAVCVVLVPIVLVVKAIVQGLSNRNENLRQDPRFRR
jgi:hypothetical protein